MKKLLSLLALVACLLATGHARGDSAGRDAGKHFARGVELYTDGDFRGALVEFKRAYAILPRSSVLYDIGETEFQLQEYAIALGTMRRFLSETGPSAPHRAEVEATVEILRGRVGRVAVTVDADHCDVSIDDQAVATTPMPEPATVSVGPRKVVVACSGHPVVSRQVEVVAGELVRVDLKLGVALTEAPPPVPVRSVESNGQRRRSLLVLSWTSTALLAATAIGVGTATLVESSQLDHLRGSYPVQASTLDSKASLTKGLSIAADSLGVAALAAIGVSSYVTLKYHKEQKLIIGFVASGIKGSF